MRGRPHFRDYGSNDDSNARPRAQSEQREPNILRRLIQDRARELRSQSLPPDYRIPEHERQSRAVQTDPCESPEQSAQSFMRDLKASLNLQPQNWSRAVQTDGPGGIEDYRTFERRAQLLRGHFQSPADTEGPSPTQPSDLHFPVEDSGIRHLDRNPSMQRIFQLEERLTRHLDSHIEGFSARVVNSAENEKSLDLFSYHIQQEKKWISVVNNHLRYLTEHMSSRTSDSRNLEKGIKMCRDSANAYSKSRILRIQAQECANLGRPDDDTARAMLAKAQQEVRSSTQNFYATLDRFSKEKDNASLSAVMEQWIALNQAEIGRGQNRKPRL
jgi:hypothetical protein